MFNHQNKVIIVDNREDHLTTLSKPFYENGIGCKTYRYDANYNAPLTGIRIAFFDINLSELTSPESKKQQIYATLTDAIRLYISNQNGPFALIFWTSNKDLIDGFKAYVQEREENMPSPFILSHIDKDEFLETGQNLTEKVFELLNNETISLLYDFENQAFEAASKTISEVFKIIPRNDSWGNSIDFKANFDKVFSKIAESTFGFDHAKKNPTKAVYSALIPIMNYYLSYFSSPRIWDENLKSLNEAVTSGDLTYPEGFDFRLLNCVFHLEEAPDYSKEARGVVLKYLLESPLSHQYAGGEYFRALEERAKRFFDLFIQFNTAETNTAYRDNVRASSEFIFLEISAACDYSQNKSRVNKYMLGLITPIVPQELMKNKSEAILLLPEMYYKGQACQIRLNLNFVYGFEPEDEKLGVSLFKMKGGILDKIASAYAGHVSRIGITSF
jgi:hypothetical protein